MTPAVFLDRDGTLMEDVDYCRDPALVRIFSGVPEALRKLHARGFKNIVITNQSGIGRGWIALHEYEAVHAKLLDQLGDGLIDAAYFCPDKPGQPSKCRKPEPGMVFQAAEEHGLDLSRSFFIGDKDSDIECGRRAGTKTVLVKTGYGREHLDCGADFVADTFADAVEHIVGSQQES